MRISSIGIAIVLAGGTGCQGWQQLPRPTAGAGLEGNPEVARVTRTQGCGPTPSRECMSKRGTVTLYGPRIQGDSLIGYFDRDNRERVAIALTDVTNVETQKVDKLRTTGAVLGGAVVTTAIVTVVALIAVLSAWK